MKPIYHRLAVRDVREIIAHYEDTVGSRLADRFFAELLETVAKALSNPRRYPPLSENPGEFRRANLKDFPFHFIYHETLWGIKVMIVRHHRRNPKYGLRRR